MSDLIEDLLLALLVWGARKLYLYVRTEIEVAREMRSLEGEGGVWRP